MSMIHAIHGSKSQQIRFKLTRGLGFFKDLNILRLDLDGMGILDFFKKRKQDEFVETKGGHTNQAEEIDAPQDTGDSVKPALENKFKVPLDATPADTGETDPAEDMLREVEPRATSEEEVMDNVDTSHVAPPDQSISEEPKATMPSEMVSVDHKQGMAEVAPEMDDKASNDDAYLGNLAHTAIIDQLLRVPREERDDDWVGNFLTHVATASFVCGDPQVIQGPDNFPYFQIFIPEANKPFQCYVLEHMLDDFLLDNGLGIALEPKAGEVEWVLSYGDLLHYSVHRTFAIPNDHLFARGGGGDETITSDEQVLVGAPSELILPIKARGVIREFLRAQGVQDPKVCLMDRSNDGKGQDLVFNLTPWQFETEAHYRAVMQALGWFLPRYYSYTGAEEHTFQTHFLPL